MGRNGYMTWEEIKEIDKSKFGYIGHHSHTHEYLINFNNEDFENDIEIATKIFKDKLGYTSNFFLSFWRIFFIYEKIYFKKL